ACRAARVPALHAGMPAIRWATGASRMTRAGRTLPVSSRREPCQLPPIAVALVGDPVVQAAAASLPEFQRLGHHAIAAPVRRQRRRLPVVRRELGPARLHTHTGLD